MFAMRNLCTFKALDENYCEITSNGSEKNITAKAAKQKRRKKTPTL